MIRAFGSVRVPKPEPTIVRSLTDGADDDSHENCGTSNEMLIFGF